MHDVCRILLVDDHKLLMEGIRSLLADGYSVRQIGDALNISPKTVETHKYSVLTKLRAGSINELTKMAIRLGLVSL